MIDTQTEAPAAPKPAPRKYTRKVKAAPKPRQPSEFDGITATKCPTACTSERCVISTVNVCKHPQMCPITGCGPITMANRSKALKLIKHKKIDQGS